MNTSFTTPSDLKKYEFGLALRNGLKLILSLVITLGIAFAVRFWMPGFLGPKSFGVLHFAEGFAVMFFIFATLGADSYIRKEVAVRPEHASEFFGFLMILQTIITVLLVGMMTLILFMMGKDADVYILVYLFAVGQYFFVTNNKLGAMLQAQGSVNELAVYSTISKVVWGLGIFFGLILWKRLEIVAIVFLVSEAMKLPVLLRACNRHLGLALRLDYQAGKAMLVASFPFFLNTLSHTVASKIDVLMLSGMTVDQEVGWYGAAANANYMVLLVMPVVAAVVTPMSARIAAHGEHELNHTMRKMLRLTLIMTVPLALLVALNSRDLILLLFSTEYLPSVNTLVVLASMVPLVFVSTIMAIQLIQLNKIWKVTVISLVSLAINPIMNGILILPMYHAIGNGGAGLAAAIATVVTQFASVVMMFRALKGAALDKQLMLLVARFGLLCGIYIVGHHFLGRFGYWRGIIEVVLYPAVAIPLGVLPVKELIERGKEFIANRRKR